MTPATFRSPPRASIDVEGIPGAKRMLSEIARRGLDMRPPLTGIKAILFEGNRKQFESKGSYLGTPWVADKPETIARKGREGVPGLSDTMVASGDLQEALSGGDGSKSRVTKYSVRVGTSLFYAHFSLGTQDEQPRPVSGISDLETNASVRLIEDYLMSVR